MSTKSAIGWAFSIIVAMALGVLVSRLAKDKPVTMSDFRMHWFCNDLLHHASISEANGSPAPWGPKDLERYWINANKHATRALEKMGRDAKADSPELLQLKAEYDAVGRQAWKVFQAGLRGGWKGDQLKELKTCVEQYS